MLYRWQYWQGAWGVITGGATGVWQAVSSPFFWWGVGPGNFGGPYLKYKLPQASEEILDPHNLFLDVWAMAGFWAFRSPGDGDRAGTVERAGPGRASRANARRQPSTACSAARIPAGRLGLRGNP